MQGVTGDPACGDTSAMKRPVVEDPGSVNYHALEGGGWYPPAGGAEEQKRHDRGGASIVTRVIIAVIAIALVRFNAALQPQQECNQFLVRDGSAGFLLTGRRAGRPVGLTSCTQSRSMFTMAQPEPCLLAAQLVGCGFAGYRFYQHRHRVNGIHVKRIIQRHNEKHQHGEVRGVVVGSHRGAASHNDVSGCITYHPTNAVARLLQFLCHRCVILSCLCSANSN